MGEIVRVRAPVVKVISGYQHPAQRVFTLFVSVAKLDRGGRIRFEDRQPGADVARFLDEQGELTAQLDRLDADLDSRLGVSLGQQFTDRGRIAPHRVPTPAGRRFRVKTQRVRTFQAGVAGSARSVERSIPV